MLDRITEEAPRFFTYYNLIFLGQASPTSTAALPPVQRTRRSSHMPAARNNVVGANALNDGLKPYTIPILLEISLMTWNVTAIREPARIRCPTPTPPRCPNTSGTARTIITVVASG